MSASVGSATTDSVRDQTALAPIPMPAIENKPAPGQTGPKGLAPRTTYSKVNTGSPPVMDAGATAQKSGPGMGMSSLPAKVASPRGFMTTMHVRPSLQDMVKAAMLGTTQQLSVNVEAARQSSVRSGTTKTASAAPHNPKHVPTDLAIKMAEALGFIGDQLQKEAEGPGEGPGALTVLEPKSSGTNPFDAGSTGQATAGNQPPKSPSLQPDQVQTGNSGTGLETNDDVTHPAQPVEPIKNASATKVAKGDPEGHHLRRHLLSNPVSSAIEARKGSKGKAFLEAAGNNLKETAKGTGVGAAAGSALGAAAAAAGGKGPIKKRLLQGAGFGALGGAQIGAAVGGIKGNHGAKASEIHGKYSKHKEGSAPLGLIRELAKVAEDAINPAHIDSPANVDPLKPPPGASASGEDVPAEPADVTSQKRLIATNEAAINYTKAEAKADPKKDVNQVLEEPALTSSTDKVLDMAFDATGQAGVKISQAGGLRKTAMQIGAQRVLLEGFLKKASADAGATTTGQ